MKRKFFNFIDFITIWGSMIKQIEGTRTSLSLFITVVLSCCHRSFWFKCGFFLYLSSMDVCIKPYSAIDGLWISSYTSSNDQYYQYSPTHITSIAPPILPVYRPTHIISIAPPILPV